MAGDAEQLRAYVEYLRDMGVHDLYRQGEPIEAAPIAHVTISTQRVATQVEAVPRLTPPPPSIEKLVPIAQPEPVFSGNTMPKPISFNLLAPLPQARIAVSDRPG